MFLNVRSSRFWEDNLRQRIGFVGPTEAFTEEDCMRRAMGLFINLFNTHLKYGAYGFLVTLYQSVLAIEHDQTMNDYGRAVLKRFKFLLKHSHCKHYCDVLFAALNDDPVLVPTENYSSLKHRFAALYAADRDDVLPVFSIHEIAKGTPILWNYNP